MSRVGLQEVVCVLHADTLPPDDMVAVSARVMADGRTALAGFTPLICGPDGTRWERVSTTG